ncbi:MAG: HAMP domain-containing histidine kinase [Deltaproteobacteria bacterium]|nr:HAMP domain-containing histidine kinase [Deltaproteobacteria bacterium]
MEKHSDEDIVQELLRRLMDKDKANHDLRVVTKKLEEMNSRLLESEKLKSNFLSNIRNEINNPLTSVLTSCQVVMSDGGDMDAATIMSVVSAVYKEAFNLSFQLHNIFCGAELEAGETAMSISSVNVKSLIEGVISAFRHKAVDKGIHVSFDLCDRLKEKPFFSADPEKFERIAANLLSNAIEFSAEGSPVEVKAWLTDGYINVSVRDKGVGIAKADQSVIFERFKQLATGVTKTHAGHGLGLSIAKALAELMYGTISVESNAGQGSVFTVRLPESQSGAYPGTVSKEGNDFYFRDSDEPEKF